MLCEWRLKMHILQQYALLQSKKKSTYEELFRTLIGVSAVEKLNLDPEFIHMDFESAAIEAVRSVFGYRVTIRGCFYHLCQSTYRHAQSLGYASKYRDDPFFQKFCGMIDALAFLPVNLVQEGVTYLHTLAPTDSEALDMLEYFDSVYCSGRYRGRNTGLPLVLSLARLEPLFPPEMWNTHNATLSDGERTNNKTEGWNNRFKVLVGQDHPSIYLLLQKR
ncbi:uncharacterized protein [Parasteatoda tepidariorum]|uniref:uncharacterized protein n=1 Tax=Parasteatoda tepidariorum TaxID=114398 RepID=UPI0039BCBC25